MELNIIDRKNLEKLMENNISIHLTKFVSASGWNFAGLTLILLTWRK
jgi:hypothetical protein